jgi:hypothetical protein
VRGIVLGEDANGAALGVVGRYQGRMPQIEQASATPVTGLKLFDYVQSGWPILEPARKLVSAWSVQCLCEHLEAVSSGELTRLLVNVPPRATKSRTIAVFWPTWDWITKPWRRWLFNSYAQPLSLRDALAARRLIESAWYQSRWGDVYQLTDDQNRKERYDTTKTGFRVSSSVNGQNTGEGGDISVADDPHNVKEAESDLERQNVITWWTETMASRVTDFEKHARVVVMQRVHDDDLSGYLLKEGGYHHLCLPGEHEPPVYLEGVDLAGLASLEPEDRVEPAPAGPRDVPGAARDPSSPQPHDWCKIYPDPRTKPGEPLDPVRFSPSVLAGLLKELKPYGYAGQVQQRPVPRTGAVFQDAYFRPLPADFDLPGPDGRSTRQKLLKVCHFDLNYSKEGIGDHAAAAIVGIDAAWNLYLLHVWRVLVPEHALPEESALFIRTVRPPSRPTVVSVEQAAYRQVPTQNWARLFRQITRAYGLQLAVLPPKTPTGDKVSRARVVADIGQIGQLYADRGAPWWRVFINEATKFPKSKEDDQIDALSGAVQEAMELLAQQPQDETVRQYVMGAAIEATESGDWLEEVFDGRTRMPDGSMR